MLINREDTVFKKLIIPDLNQYSIFNMVIEGTFINFGLENSNYEVSEVNFTDNNLITVWNATNKKSEINKIITSNSENKLNGMIIFDRKDNILTKYFFDNYIFYNDISIPCEIIKIIYFENNEYYELTTFKNFIFNNSNNNFLPDFDKHK
jgi:hypothetical protein